MITFEPYVQLVIPSKILVYCKNWQTQTDRRNDFLKSDGQIQSMIQCMNEKFKRLQKFLVQCFES